MSEELADAPAEKVVDLNFWREGHPRPEHEDDHDGGGGGGPPEGGAPGDEGPRPTWGSDDALALQLASRLDGDWYYVAGWEDWLYWDGQIWERDIGLSVHRHIREVCRWVSARIDTKSLARSISSGRTIFNVERLARSDARIARKAGEFDADDWLINTPGGVVIHVRTQKCPLDTRREIAFLRRMSSQARHCADVRSRQV